MKPAKPKAQTKVVTRPAKTGFELRGDNRVLLSAPEHEVILSGGADTGKTTAACIKVHLICLRCPGAQGAIVRKTKTSLRGTVLNTFNRIINNQGVAILGGEHPNRYIYPNGSMIWLGGMDDPDKVLSAERDFIYVNQTEELSLNDWEMLATRCSGRASVIKTPQLFGDCNPGGSKHWIRERAKLGKIRLLVTSDKDNPTLYNADGTMIDSPDVRRRMAVLDNMTGVRRLRLKEGIWATAEGAVYEMFNAAVHVQTRDQKEFKQFFLAMDEGFTNPAVILVIGADSDGRWHCFREYYKTNIIPENVVAEAKKWYQEFRCTMAGVDESAAGLIASLNSVGVRAVGGKGRVLDGIQVIQNRLKVQGDGRPRYTVDPSCENHINEFESYIWKPEKDVPEKEFDHTLDAIRYLHDALHMPEDLPPVDPSRLTETKLPGDELGLGRFNFDELGLGNDNLD